MKSTILLLLSAVALSKSFKLNTAGCPVDPAINVLFAHENCNQYYHCKHGELLVRNCPVGLVFNDELDLCDWPDNVNCDRTVVPPKPPSGGGSDVSSEAENDGDSTNNNPGEASIICAAEDSDGILIAHENCNQFYKCSNGLPVTISCPLDLLYNPEKENCDWPENVNCDRTVVTPEPPNSSENNSSDDSNNSSNNGSDSNESNNNSGDSNESNNSSGNSNESGSDSGNNNPGEAATICAAEGSDGILVPHENCNQFYKCSDGLPVALSCPGNLLYNALTEQCDWPENVNCGGTVVTPETPDSSENNSSGDSNNNSNNGEDSNESNGNGGDSNESNDNGSDSNESGSDSGNNNPGEAATICAAEGSDGILVPHENCNQFYKCSDGLPVALSCPGNLLYNALTEQCDWPENVNCGGTVVTPETPDSSENNSSDDSNSSSENGGDSNESNGNGGDSNESNDNGSDSNESGSDGGNNNPGEAATICAAEGSDGILVPHENCNQFYKCSDGLPVALSCPGNLLYNALTEQCDWPENVNCGGTIVTPETPDSSENNSSGDSNNSGNNGGDSNESNNNGGDSNESNNNSGDSNESGSDGGNNNPGEAATICAAEGSDGILVSHENCNQFYICSDGLPVALSCPGSLLYNPLTKQCDWPENVNCDGTVVTPGTPDSSENNSSGDSNNSSNNGGDSNESNGNGSDSNESNDNGDDSNESGSDAGNNNPGEAATICAAEGSDGILVSHENCNQFYICSDGLPVTLRCPGNLLYNALTEQCDWPENVNCKNTAVTPETPDSSESNSSDDSNESNDNGDDGGDSNESNDNGGSSNDSGSGEGNNSNPGEAATICAAEGSDGILVAHENCNQFYKCSEGLPVALSCPGNLLYNALTEQCDWPSNVVCSN
ncbi:dentin sialophosphoprotein-like [Galleria mellonella]|uniref:Dentin sialophosphoprotein-like n=1 Tax=Galleria mellonella TaxID=7137 RepID=A0A6J1WGU7_GALME|nr:dentin sialophosphoprotein-like [Galleria mellonella]